MKVIGAPVPYTTRDNSKKKTRPKPTFGDGKPRMGFGGTSKPHETKFVFEDSEGTLRRMNDFQLALESKSSP